MSTLIRPVGTREPQIYWRRRVLALVALVVVVALVVWGVSSALAALRGGDDTGADAGTTAQEPGTDPAGGTQPSTEPSSAATTTAPAEGAACAAPTLVVAPTADLSSYPLGSTATIGMTITNTGTTACTMDAGSAALELLVVSGADRIWSSDDCQTDPQSRPTTVEPGEAGVLASSVEWTLARSAPGCADGLPALKAGTYQLTARAGDITSAPLAFQITG